MSDKGFVNMLELVVVTITMFITISVLFPGLSHKSKWDQAYLTLTARDAILTMDRLNVINNYSFNKTTLQNFLNESIHSENILYWSETGGTFKNKIIIGCNCTEDQISNLVNWFGSLRLNNRNIQTTICYTTLEKINPCNDPEDLSHTIDVLLIWGYASPSQSSQDLIVQKLQDFLNNGNGVIEMADLTQVDKVQETVFGIELAQAALPPTYNQFNRNPINSTDIIYSPYKFFYHMPIPLITSSNTTPSIPVEGLPQPSCINFTEGSFTFNQTPYKFWDCDGTSVYFDTTKNSIADKRLYPYDNFKIEIYNFSLRYIDGLNKIGVAFNTNYLFGDFLGLNVNLKPKNNENERVLVSASPSGQSVVILNSSIGNAAWLADISDNGYGDDEKLLLLSLLMWGSNKRTSSILSPNLKLGYSASYINTVNLDMFEVYKFNLGLGNPYK